MASPSVLRSESVGLQRFGLGFGLGQTPDIRTSARERLLAEIERRSAEYDAGNSQPIHWEQVRAESRGRAGLQD